MSGSGMMTCAAPGAMGLSSATLVVMQPQQSDIVLLHAVEVDACGPPSVVAHCHRRSSAHGRGHRSAHRGGRRALRCPSRAGRKDQLLSRRPLNPIILRIRRRRSVSLTLCRRSPPGSSRFDGAGRSGRTSSRARRDDWNQLARTNRRRHGRGRRHGCGRGRRWHSRGRRWHSRGRRRRRGRRCVRVRIIEDRQHLPLWSATLALCLRSIRRPDRRLRRGPGSTPRCAWGFEHIRAMPDTSAH